MRCLVIYDEINSSAAGVAKDIIDNINCEFKRAFPVKRAKDACLLRYDYIILGGSINRGKIPGDLKRYVDRNKKTLESKNFSIYIVCYDKEKVDKYLYKSFSKELINSSYSYTYFLDKNDSGFFSKKNKMEPEKIEKINKENINNLIDEVNKINSSF